MVYSENNFSAFCTKTVLINSNMHIDTKKNKKKKQLAVPCEKIPLEHMSTGFVQYDQGLLSLTRQYCWELGLDQASIV